MEHSVSAILNVLIGVAITFAAGAGTALMLSDRERHSRLASRLLISACFISCAYPILWAWNSPQPIIRVAALGGLWGCFAGATAYCIYLWFKNESEHRSEPPGAGNDSQVAE